MYNQDAAARTEAKRRKTMKKITLALLCTMLIAASSAQAANNVKVIWGSGTDCTSFDKISEIIKDNLNCTIGGSVVISGCVINPTQKPEFTPAPTAEPTTAPTAEPTVVPTVAPTAEPTTAPTTAPTQAPSTQNTMEQEVLTLVNKVRQENGLSAVTWAEDVANVARAHSADMINRGFFSHTPPDGLSPFDRLKNNGISYRTASENIAYGQKTAQAVMDSWMNSSGHRANILNANVKEMGVGAVKNSSGTVYWTQMFVAR